MQTLTINVPDETASRLDTLPDSDRRIFLEKMTNFAVASLGGMDEGEDYAEEGDLPADIYLTHPLPASLTEPLTETARKVNAAIEAGDLVDGETFLANMRKLAGRA